MKYLSVCAGIEAATQDWHHLGWEPVAFSEIEPFPSAVLQHHYPNVPNWGDMTQFKTWPDATIDVLVGGTPCQSFSVAGLRKGLEDPRGNLMLTFLGIADRYKPKWIVWENVPGVLSSNGGRDFGTFLAALGELGYGWAYRVLDAQWFGVAQRRRRVFVVGCLGDQRSAAAVLFESESVSRHPAPSREARKGTATDAEASVGAGSWWNGEDLAGTLTKQNANGAQRMPDKDNFGAVLMRNREGNADCGVELCGPLNARDYKDPGTDGMNRNSAKMIPILMRQREGKDGGGKGPLISEEKSLTLATSNDQVLAFRDPSPTITSKMQGASGWAPYNEDAHLVGVQHTSNDQVLAFSWQSGGDARGAVPRPTAQLQRCQVEAVLTPMAVRRLTPVECERLQGFPDNFTRIPWKRKPAEECPDGPRYKALGNSMAVPCMRWIGERINKQAHDNN